MLTNEGRFPRTQFTSYLTSLTERYPILSIEDGMDEADWTGWKMLTDAVGKRVQLVGDDLFVTNTAILNDGIKAHVANAILIKFNQIGSLTETLAAIRMAKKRGLCDGDFAPFRRNRRHHDRRPGGGDRCRSDQDGFVVAVRSRREVQPVAANRRATG